MSNIRQRLTPSKIKLNDQNNEKPRKLNQCVNHQNKKAKYHVVKETSLQLCSKCAVNMVGKGMKVEEIPGLEEEYRRDQILKFITSVNNSIPQIDKLMNALIAKREDIQKYYDQQRDKVERFHIQISQCLEDEKMRLLQQLFTNFKTLSKQYDDSINCLQLSRSETISMKTDVESNLDGILRQMQNEPFNEIMTSYNKNLQLFIDRTECIQKTPIEVLKVTLNEPINITHLMTVHSLKTCLIKKNLQEQKNKIESNHSVYISFENKEQFTQPKLPKMAPSFNKTPKKDQEYVQPFEIKTEEIYEEGHSQMIERDDIENSYQMMLIDNQSDAEEQKPELDIIKSFGPSNLNNNTLMPNNKVLVSKIISRANEKNDRKIDKNYAFKGINTSLKLV
ncbi:unnamed protein product [Paramecium primaurelia]|uniref:Uncharacterized protein n=1 Tax=Paramecium primaurelia TaxID=5886 RepID=A0A8S1N907_PARPR|nr:unnamed protein product [Paramecium primaurelia]